MEVRELIKQLISKASDSNLIQWNDGLNFAEFIHAIWRLFLNHDSFKQSAEKILKKIPESSAIEILAQEINVIRAEAV